MDRFPPELISLIVDNIPSIQALRSSALVGRAWSAPSQKWLFRTIELYTYSQCIRFYSLLVESPHIIPYIRDFTIIADSFVDAEALLGDRETLPGIFQRFLRLERLRIRLGWESQWNTLSEDLRASITSTLRLPSLTTLFLRHIYFDPKAVELHELLRHAPQLKCLYLYGPYGMVLEPTDFGDGQGYTKVTQRIALEGLAIGFCERNTGLKNWMFSPLCRLDLSGLKFLHILTQTKGEDISRLFAMVGPSLEELIIEPHELYSRNGLDLSFKPNLRFIEFHFVEEQVVEHGVCPPEWFHTSLSSIPASNSLEEVSLDILLYYPGDDPTKETVLGWDYSPWSRLVTTLTSLKFRRLRTVKVDVTFFIYAHRGVYDALVLRALEPLGARLVFGEGVNN